MKPSVKVAGVWQQATPLIKQGGQWIPVENVFFKIDGTWGVVYENTFVVNLPGAAVNYNLSSAIGVPAQKQIVVNIPALTRVISNHPAIPAFRLGNPYTGKHITINNYGKIWGCGGTAGGGGANGGRGGNGGAGGTALDVTEAANPVIVNNHGQIFGGGGGGGGGGSYRYDARFVSEENFDFVFGVNAISNGGRGGNGAQGTNGAPSGAAGQGWQPHVQYFMRTLGGNGGNGGLAGHAGNAGQASTVYVDAQGLYVHAVYADLRGLGGAGGRAGYAINGNSKARLTNAGDIRGARVN